MSDSPLPKKSNDKPEVQFTADKIGHWASKQENPFAEQNRKAAAKKQREHEQAKKATPIVAIILGVAATIAAVGGLVVLIVFLINLWPKPEEAPIISGDSAADISDYRDILQDFYNNDGIDKVDSIINNALDTNEGKEYTNQLLLSQALFYYDNSMCERVLSIGKQIDEGRLTNQNKQMFYNIMYDCYARTGNKDLSDQYFDKLYDLSDAMAGEEVTENDIEE